MGGGSIRMLASVDRKRGQKGEEGGRGVPQYRHQRWKNLRFLGRRIVLKYDRVWNPERGEREGYLVLYVPSPSRWAQCGERNGVLWWVVCFVPRGRSNGIYDGVTLFSFSLFLVSLHRKAGHGDGRSYMKQEMVDISSLLGSNTGLSIALSFFSPHFFLLRRDWDNSR
jgi:hypothetical protein